MKTLTLILAALFLAGCANMSPSEKRAWAVVGTAVVVGTIAANDSSDKPKGTDCYIVVSGPDSNTVCP